jgi:hypothetical protein
MNKRQYFVSELVSKERMLEDALQKAKDGDKCLIHYHHRGETCNNLCHDIVPPTPDKE